MQPQDGVLDAERSTIWALVFLASLAVAIVCVVAFFALWLALPFWWHEWAVGLPVLVFVPIALGICAWIGWTMATTPPPMPLETGQVDATAEVEPRASEDPSQ